MINIKDTQYNPNEAVFPGATLLETLKNLGMSQTELSKRISRPEKTISEIINGQTAITADTAIQLEIVLGIPASFWNNLEKNYRETRARIDAKQQMLTELESANKYPIREMMKMNWIEKTTQSDQIVERLLKFFGVTSFNNIPKTLDLAFRNHHSEKIYIEGLHAWLRKGELDAAKIDTDVFNASKLRVAMAEIRTMTNQNPQEYSAKLIKLLGECGVALCFVPKIPKTYVCGVARWLSSNKAMIQLSLRGSYADIMWFTLLHEIGHLILHGKRTVHVDFDNGIDVHNELEIEANNFASEALISKSDFHKLISGNVNNPHYLKRLAIDLGINVGIVIGRLQHEKILRFNSPVNYLREKYTFVAPEKDSRVS